MHRAGGPQQPLSGSPKRLRPASTVSFSRLPVPSPRPLPAPAHSLAPVGGPVLPLPSLPSPSGRCPQVPIELPGTTTSPPPLHPCTLVQRLICFQVRSADWGGGADGPGSSPGFATHQLCDLGHSPILSMLPSDHENKGIHLPGLHVRHSDQWPSKPSEKMLL